MKTDLSNFKNALQIVRTGKDSKGTSFNDIGTLNQAAWIGENSGILIREIESLRSEMQQIVDMCMGDGLNYCASLTEPKPMTEREMIHHAPIIRGCFMGIAHKARAAIT